MGTYTSSDGNPLNLNFLDGEIEGAPFDFLLVTDGNGTVLYNDEGNDGDLAGLSFQSITDTITIQITSDGSVSCESGSFCCSDGINFTVAHPCHISSLIFTLIQTKTYKTNNPRHKN